MENKDSYTPKEIVEMASIHLNIMSNLNNLKNKITETKEELCARGKGKDFDRIWGLGLRNRYEEANKLFEKTYKEAIPKNVRESLELEGLLPNFNYVKIEPDSNVLKDES